MRNPRQSDFRPLVSASTGSRPNPARQRRWSLAFLALLVFAAAPQNPALGDVDPGIVVGDGRMIGTKFLIESRHGFGLIDCLDGRHDCGRLVADAYCASHGFARAVKYGPATEAVSRRAAPDLIPGAIYIECGCKYRIAALPSE